MMSHEFVNGNRQKGRSISLQLISPWVNDTVACRILEPHLMFLRYEILLVTANDLYIHESVCTWSARHIYQNILSVN